MANAQVRANGSVKQAIAEFFAAEARNAQFIEKHRLGLSQDDDLPPYRHQQFPRMLFGSDGTNITVANQQEEKQRLKEGWFENPEAAQKAALEAA